MSKINTEIQFWADKADAAHAKLGKLVKRYENATPENYRLLLSQIHEAEKDIELFEAKFDELMVA